MNEGTKKLVADMGWTLRYHTDKAAEALETLSALATISPEVAEAVEAVTIQPQK